MDLMLNDLLRLGKEELDVTKVRLNQNNGEIEPIEEFKRNPQNLLSWNYWNNESYRVGQLSVGLVRMQGDDWLLFTVGRITGIKDIPQNTGVGFDYETLDNEYGHLFGRVVVSYHNRSQNMFRNAPTIMDSLIVKKVLPDVYTGFDFPGYDRVCLSYGELEEIVKGNHPGYQNALENQQAVYVLTDTCTGKLYVGSATSRDKMLLARWRGYVDTFHNDNAGLKELFEAEGADYFKSHFTYAIIENFNARTNPEFILGRESYWKRVLATREHGYNRN